METDNLSSDSHIINIVDHLFSRFHQKKQKKEIENSNNDSQFNFNRQITDWKIINQILYEYTEFVYEEYSINRPQVIESEKQSKIKQQTLNNKPHKKIIMLRSPNNSRHINNNQRTRNIQKNNEIKQVIDINNEMKNQRKNKIYTEHNQNHCSVDRDYSMRKNKNQTPSTNPHMRSKSAYLSLQMPKNSEKNQQIIPNDNFTSELSDVQITEFDIGNDLNNCLSAQNKRIQTQESVLYYGSEHRLTSQLRMCPGCEQYISKNNINQHELECSQIRGLYTLSDIQLISETSKKMSTKKISLKSLLKECQGKNNAIQRLCTKMHEYLNQSRLFNEEQEEKMMEAMVEESQSVFKCVEEVHKIKQYRKIKQSLEVYSRIKTVNDLIEQIKL